MKDQRPNKITGPNAGGSRQFPIPMPLAARVGQFWRSRENDNDAIEMEFSRFDHYFCPCFLLLAPNFCCAIAGHQDRLARRADRYECA